MAKRIDSKEPPPTPSVFDTISQPTEDNRRNSLSAAPPSTPQESNHRQPITEAQFNAALQRHNLASQNEEKESKQPAPAAPEDMEHKESFINRLNSRRQTIAPGSLAHQAGEIVRTAHALIERAQANGVNPNHVDRLSKSGEKTLEK